MHPMFRNPTLLLTLALAAALAPFSQEPPATPPFRASVPVVLVPVTVTGRNGKFVDGLQAADFSLTADGKPRSFEMDLAEAVVAPLAVVVAIQTNDLSQTANLKVRKVGSLVQPLITGNRGRAAVIGYGETTVVLSDFTHDPDAISLAFQQSAASQGGNAARQLDAILIAARMLAARPAGERKVLIILGESKDRGSKARLADVLRALQNDAVTVFAATWSPYKTAFTTRGTEMPPPNSGTDLLAGIGELGRLGKGDSAKALAESTGGEKLTFATLSGLEKALTHLGEELHSQYLLSFAAQEPGQTIEAGLHSLEVKVKNRKGLTIRARSGFWFGELSEAQP